MGSTAGCLLVTTCPLSPRLADRTHAHQNAEFRPAERSHLLGESQKLRDRVRSDAGVPVGRALHLPHQRHRKRGPGTLHRHHQLQDLQICSSRRQQSSEGHPFRQFMDSDVALPADKVSQLTDSLVNRMNNTLAKLKSIFLVEDVLESVKFGVSMYLLTYVGAILNGLTVLILAWVGLFSLPRVYRDNQKQIDDAVLPLK